MSGFLLPNEMPYCKHDREAHKGWAKNDRLWHTLSYISHEILIFSTLRRKLLGGFKMFLNMPILNMGHVWSKENLKWAYRYLYLRRTEPILFPTTLFWGIFQSHILKHNNANCKKFFSRHSTFYFIHLISIGYLK